jgi:AcrR family transcriptional regulator
MSAAPAPFRRARSEEQREVRRRVILRTAADMLAEMPVAELSLNELSRRVGLAKSNVLRYFETREAVLLELLDNAWRDWLARLADEVPAVVETEADVTVRYERLAATVAGSVVADPLLWELISVSAAVLERNVSPEVARRYKLAATANTRELARMTRARLPEISAQGAFHFAGAGLLAIGAMWPLAHPAEAMRKAYDAPGLADLRVDGPGTLREILATLLAGCLSRWPSEPSGNDQAGRAVGHPTQAALND